MNNEQRLLNNLSSVPTYSSVVTKKEAQSLLAYEFVFCHGAKRDIRVKHIGAGMYKVFTERG